MCSPDFLRRYKLAEPGDLPHLPRIDPESGWWRIWLEAAGAELFPGADFLIPVPLHRWRLLKRRYNQAAVLAASLAKKTGIAVLPLALKRIRATESQGRKTKIQRAEGPRGPQA